MGPSSFVILFGAVLFLAALGWHVREAALLEAVIGPRLALVVDGVPALAVVYPGYRVSNSELSRTGRWVVAVWRVAGAVAAARRWA